MRTRNFWGYAAGITTGATYGMNPLFAMPVLGLGVSIDTVLFFRYSFAVILLGTFIALSGKSFRINLRQGLWLGVLGVLYSLSSLGLFLAYKFIPSGIATTIVFLYPILVALIMCLLRVFPNWQTWMSIAVTAVAMMFLCRFEPGRSLNPVGILLSSGSALAYALFIVTVNRNECIRDIPNDVLTFYALAVGTVVFTIHALTSGTGAEAAGASSVAQGWNLPLINDIRILNAHPASWVNLILLALIPTIVSTATLAAATRIIGSVKASVLGVFEPITAILIGALMFNEKITANIVTGICLVIFAIVFMIVSPDFHNLAKFAKLKHS